MAHKYDDIIGLARPVSEKRVRMPIADRAAQFSPFAALTGYDDVIRETARLTDFQIELDETEKIRLNETLQKISRNIGDSPQIRVTWFLQDERKLGGAYVSFTGKVKKIDIYREQLLFHDGTVIPIGLIYCIEEEN